MGFSEGRVFPSSSDIRVSGEPASGGVRRPDGATTYGVANPQRKLVSCQTYHTRDDCEIIFKTSRKVERKKRGIKGK